MAAARSDSPLFFNVANADANVTFIQCDKPNQVGPRARRQIWSQVMRTSWRKQKSMSAHSLPAPFHKDPRPFDLSQNIDSMAIPDYLIAMQLGDGRSEPSALENVVGILSPPRTIAMH
jgi:hypothetical protein